MSGEMSAALPPETTDGPHASEARNDPASSPRDARTPMADDLPPELALVGEASARRLLELAAALNDAGPGEWAVLIGAGLSADFVPTWDSFLRCAAQRFSVDVGKIADDNYPRVAQDCLEAAATPEDFWAFAESRLCVDGHRSRGHELAVSLPAGLFLTTNFDCLLEAPHSELAVRHPRRLVYPDLSARFGGEGRLVYLHGRCDCGAEPGAKIDPDRIVLTVDGYDRAYSQPAGPLPLFVQSVFSSMRVLLVGFSLKDFYMRKLLDAVRQAGEERGRAGAEVRRGRHLAIVPTESEPPTTDYEFGGLTYQIDPIFYRYYPGAAQPHGAVVAILEWLVEVTGGRRSLPIVQEN